MSEKITIKTLWNILDEIEKGAKDTSRTTDNIADSQVKKIINEAKEVTLKSIPTVGTIESSKTGGILGGVLGGASAISGAGMLAGSTTSVISGLTASGLTGGAVGSAVPIVGTAIGVVAGAGLGLAIGLAKSNKNKKEKERLMQEVIAKQNGVIQQLKKEFDTLKTMYKKSREQNQRYEYLLGILSTFEDMSTLNVA